MFLTANEVVAMLGVSRVTFEKMKKRDGLPFVRLSEGVIRYDKDEILKWIEDRKRLTKEQVQKGIV